MFSSQDIYNIQYWSTQINGKANTLKLIIFFKSKGFTDEDSSNIANKIKWNNKEKVGEFLHNTKNLQNCDELVIAAVLAFG